MSEDGVFRYKVAAEDRDGDAQLQFRLKDAPAGMSIHPIRGDVTWSPAPDQAGTHTISVIVDDLHGGRSSQTFEVTVSAPAGSLPAKAR